MPVTTTRHSCQIYVLLPKSDLKSSQRYRYLRPQDTALNQTARSGEWTSLITGVGSIAILVNDARKSAQWYHDKLGFEIIGIEGHTVLVRTKGSHPVLLHLCERCKDWGDDRPGGRTGVWLQCGETTISRDRGTRRVTPASNLKRL
jgi:hypothetical protein